MPPAARVGDMHVCPMVTPGVPPIPHVGGPILPPGCPTVLIGGQFAARVGDLAVCVGPPDPIVLGSFTVFIGGPMAARMGDMTGHGGVIVVGLPTVMIGDAGSGAGGGPGTINGMPVVRLPDGRMQVGDHIFIQGAPGFQMQAVNDLAAIGATPTGASILNALNSGTHNTTISFLDMATAQANGALATRLNPAGATTPGVGSDTNIQYNPNLVDNTYVDENGNNATIPVQSTLAHEMIHAVHNDQGANLRNQPDPSEPGSNQEESRTIGINDHAGEAMSENALLRDMGVPYQRTDHDSSVVTNP
jgi:uncharacterized Zn-binding protein involved in type VI secretion